MRRARWLVRAGLGLLVASGALAMVVAQRAEAQTTTTSELPTTTTSTSTTTTTVPCAADTAECRMLREVVRARAEAGFAYVLMTLLLAVLVGLAATKGRT